MSTSYSSYILYGIRIDPTEDLPEPEQVRGCEHPLPKEDNAAFCSECGGKLWLNPDDVYPPWLRDLIEDDGDCGIHVQSTRQEEGDLIIGVMLSEIRGEGESGHVALDAAEVLLDKCAKAEDKLTAHPQILELFERPDINGFEMHHILYCSY